MSPSRSRKTIAGKGLLFLIIAAFAAGLFLPLQPAAAEERENEVLGEESSLLLSDADAHYDFPAVDGFNYDKIGLDSVYVLVRQLSPAGTIDYLKSNEKNKAHMGAFAQLMSYYVFREYFREMKLSVKSTTTIEEAALAKAADMGGRLMGFVPGESFTASDLFHAMLLSGAADACYQLLRMLGTSEEAFVQRMNVSADALGMHDTRYQDPVGIKSEDAYTTLADTAVLFEELLQDEFFRSVIEKRSYRTQATPSYPDGMRFTSVMEDYAEARKLDISMIDGGKTGAGTERAYSFVSFHREGDSTYLILSSRAKTAGEELLDHLSILEKMQEIPFDYPLLAEGAVLAALPIRRDGAIDETLGRQIIRAPESRSVTLPLICDLGRFKLELALPEALSAPLTAGRKAGSYRIIEESAGASEELFSGELRLPDDPEALAAAASLPQKTEDAAASDEKIDSSEKAASSAAEKGTEAKHTKNAEPSEDEAEQKSHAPVFIITGVVLLLLFIGLYIRRKRIEAERIKLHKLRKLKASYAFNREDSPDVSEILDRSRKKREQIKEKEKKQKRR